MCSITHLLPDSVADQSGCIQIGDRLLSINKLYNLDATTIRQILGDLHNGGAANYNAPGPYWVELEIEFDMADSVIPSSGVFNVKLAKSNRHGLGITVNGTSHGTFVIAEVKCGMVFSAGSSTYAFYQEQKSHRPSMLSSPF